MKPHTQNQSTGHTAGEPVSNSYKLEGHAPGPWSADWETGHIISPGIKQAGKIVCTLPGTNAEGYRYANARLIAAAPDLLAALIQLEWAHSQLLGDRGCIESILSEERMEDVIHSGEQARTAIAKAKGQ